MALSKFFWGVGLGLCVACTKTNGAWGPQGYEQSMAKYRVNFADVNRKEFLPNDWRLDNYTYDAGSKKWHEKDGTQYRAERLLDEDGDGTITASETHTESIYDLRFVNNRDNAVIWLKVHPMDASQANLDLDVLLENYADGLAGTGLFEQSSLFGLSVDKVRHFTSFIVKKEPTALGKLPAIRGVIEIADLDKLRLDRTHRDSKAELVFAKVIYLEDLGPNKPSSSRWPIAEGMSSNGQYVHYKAQRTGLLVIGYYDDATRFESHLPDLHALLERIEVPDSAIPPNAEPPAKASSPTLATSAPGASSPAPGASATSADRAAATPAPSASAAPATPAPATSATTSATPAPNPPPAATEAAPAKSDVAGPSTAKPAAPKSRAAAGASAPAPAAATK
ncbi:MAG TPA: hypothetical protein VER11_32585 [Polyangiaceae bacterium]|nr:hypothetical protein [Polyangiaceae bacterium]